jgi:hypothetical protein
MFLSLQPGSTNHRRPVCRMSRASFQKHPGGQPPKPSAFQRLRSTFRAFRKDLILERYDSRTADRGLLEWSTLPLLPSTVRRSRTVLYTERVLKRLLTQARRLRFIAD